MGDIDAGMTLQNAAGRLSEPEQRLYALAKQPIPLAEVAVRLGVSIAEADRRVGLLCATLGFADRAALQLGAVAAPPEAESDGGADVPERVARTFSRRAVLVAAGAGLAAVAAGGTWAASWRGTSKRPTVADVTPTALPTAVDEGRIERDDSWERRDFPGLSPLRWPAAVYFVKVTDGSVEGYQTTLADAPAVFANGEVLVAGIPGAAVCKAYHRTLAQGYRWAGQSRSLVAATVDWMLFEELGPRGGGPGEPTGKFRMVGYDLQELLRFETPGGTQFQQRVLVSPDGTRAAIWSRTSTEASLLRVNLESGAIETRFDLELQPPLQVSSTTPVQIPGTNDLMFEINLYGGPNAQPPRQVRARWDGDWSELYALPGERIHSWSPGGRMSLAEVALRGFTGGGGEGGGENWPAIIVRNSEGQMTARVLSAALYYGDGVTGRWLADGSGFVALVDNGRTEGPGWDRIGYAIFSPNGILQERLPLPEYDKSHQTWWRSLFYMGATPHPTDPNLLAFGRTAVHNRATKQWMHVDFDDPAGPAHLNPWSGRANEIVLSVPHLGHGGGGIPALLPPRAWPVGVPGFRVEGTGDCVNMRESPSLQAKAITCLADGTYTEVTTPPGPSSNISFIRNEEGAWAYVTTGRLSGWVSSAYLRWDVPGPDDIAL